MGSADVNFEDPNIVQWFHLIKSNVFACKFLSKERNKCMGSTVYMDDLIIAFD